MADAFREPERVFSCRPFSPQSIIVVVVVVAAVAAVAAVVASVRLPRPRLVVSHGAFRMPSAGSSLPSLPAHRCRQLTAATTTVTTTTTAVTHRETGRARHPLRLLPPPARWHRRKRPGRQEDAWEISSEFLPGQTATQNKQRFPLFGSCNRPAYLSTVSKSYTDDAHGSVCTCLWRLHSFTLGHLTLVFLKHYRGSCSARPTRRSRPRRRS